MYRTQINIIYKNDKLCLFLKQYMLQKLRFLLWPFSILYGVIIMLRNKAYDWNIFKSTSFNIPTIVVGNLAVGGAGKSPMTEYLIRMLAEKNHLATLSRGYGRNTKGFFKVEEADEATKVGDEPLQFKRKFPTITVAVCEDRVEGVRRLKSDHDLIILDDAFQHRALNPGFSLLLLEYKSVFKPKLLLPAGDFRDTYSQRKRADIIIISKSPQNISGKQRLAALKLIKPSFNQKVLFSYLKYGTPYYLVTSNSLEKEPNVIVPSVKSQLLTDPQVKHIPEFEPIQFESIESVLVLTGIADPTPLIDYLETQIKNVYLLSYPDHYYYTKADIQKISTKFESIKGRNKIILTTEKDAQRLVANSLLADIQSLPIVVLPVEAAFNAEDGEQLSIEIGNYCQSYTIEN